MRVRSGLVVSAAAAATAGVVVAAGILGDAAQTPRPAPPAGPGLELHLSDAEAVRPGHDLDVVLTHTHDALGFRGEYVAGTTEDDQILLFDEVAVGGNDDAVRVGLLDPGSGAKQWLPETDLVVTQPLELSEERLVFLVEVEDRGPELGIFDRTSGTWSSITWPGLAELPKGFGEAHVGPDDRLYIGMEPADRSASGLRWDLWSASLTDPSDLRDEQTPVIDFDVTGRSLTWASGPPLQSPTLHTRDLSTGEETPLDATIAKGCRVADLVRSDDFVAVAARCGGDEAGQVQVLGADGRTMATITGLEGGSLDLGLDVADDWVVFSSAPRNDDPGLRCTLPEGGLFGSREGAEQRELARAFLEADSCAEMREVYREHVGDPGDAFQEKEPTAEAASVSGYFAFDTGSGALLRLNEQASDHPSVRLTSNDWLLYDEPGDDETGRRQQVATVSSAGS